ncbi:hypothetical protein ACFXTH_019700 [Malus domestica]
MRLGTHELITPVEVNHQLGAPQHGGSPSFDMGIPDKERATHRNVDQHETSLNQAALTLSMRNEGRHFLAEGMERSRAIYRDCRDFLRQRRENSIHIGSKVKDPRVIERLGPLPQRRPTPNPRNEPYALEGQEGEGDLGDFQTAHLESQYSESKKKPHAFDQTSILLRDEENLQMKVLMMPDSTQDPLIMHLLEEVNRLKTERYAQILGWDQPRLVPLTKRIIGTPLQGETKQKLGL